MRNDEQSIRDLVAKWVPGQEPFGKETFVANTKKMAGVQIEATSNIQEIKVLGDWAWMRNHLTVTMTPPGKPTTTHSGYILTVLRKKLDGAWAIARDANLLTG